MPCDAVIRTPRNVAMICWSIASSTALAFVAADDGAISTALRIAPPCAVHRWAADGLPKYTACT
ncbi:hypothetical protein KGA66_25060 [Actinocrinis puniceicyclus]|uniref:Uncharacterized protein n=1 Tax=Actinocrinis puniceicyclus TaxID=977794 RepID=A0A8J8BF70_9ACTN|nr:hypothetical protein [Actinocrinis puniceicyclus]MBS2966340.1 hypothetical protein [Actinocrinis puniceicyclus]